jgi:alkylhydroperoxidase family enzyme
MARIPLVEPHDAPPEVLAAYRELEAKGFKLFNVMKVFAQSPTALAGFVQMVKALYVTPRISPRHRELAYLRASQINACHY